MRPAPKSKNRAHTGSMEIRAIWPYIDLTWRSNSGEPLVGGHGAE